MSRGTIVFVHGTGVRFKDYKRGFDNAKNCAQQAGISADFEECAWGDPLGVEFIGLSLPDLPSSAQNGQAGEDFARWYCLYADPLFELNLLTIRDTSTSLPITMPGQQPEWELAWDGIAAYRPSLEFRLLLERGNIQDYWDSAWSEIFSGSAQPRQAFEASAHELAEAAHALARAVVAQLSVNAELDGVPRPNKALRDKLVERLIADWGFQVYGLSAFFTDIFKRAATGALRKHREGASRAAALPIGDILLYQSRGEGVREYIRAKIEQATPPVTLIAHSLGGIASVDLLALPNPPKVERLVTAGSQSPLLYELGVLFSLQPPQPLPDYFPPWLNLYDRNDFLSYVAGRLWPKVKDVEIDSGKLFLDSHSNYFNNEATWLAIRQFMGQ